MLWAQARAGTSVVRFSLHCRSQMNPSTDDMTAYRNLLSDRIERSLEDVLSDVPSLVPPRAQTAPPPQVRSLCPNSRPQLTVNCSKPMSPALDLVLLDTYSCCMRSEPPALSVSHQAYRLALGLCQAP